MCPMFDPRAYSDEIAAILALDGNGERLMPLAGGTCSSAEARSRLKASRLPPEVLAGADVTLMTSVLLINGPEFLRAMLLDVTRWLEDHEYSSVEQLKGSMSRGNCPDPGALERANYTQALINYSTQHSVPYSK